MIMRDLPRQKLQDVVRQYGSEIAEDRRRLEALLAYLCGDEYRLEVNLLMGALHENVAKELSGAQKGIPAHLLAEPLVQRLQDNLGVTTEAAQWAVDSWLIALGFHEGAEPELASESELPPPVDWSAHLWTMWWYIKNFPTYFSQQVRLTWGLMFDARVPVLLKLIPLLALAYILSPIGLIVDLIPVAGLLANVAVFMLALVLFNGSAPRNVAKEHMTRIRSKPLLKKDEIPSGEEEAASKTKQTKQGRR
jgi:uncharacterized membrane protein YkvA (DUF1232 family)